MEKANIELRESFDGKFLFSLCYPVVLEQLLTMVVGLMDTLMVSYAGEEALSGVSLVNQLNTLFVFVCAATASGGAVVVSQYIGKRDLRKGCRASGQLVTLLLVFGFVMTVIFLVFGEVLFSLLFGKVSEGIFSSGMEYLRITSLSIPFLALYNAAISISRSMGRTRPVLYASLLMNVINIIGNYIGVFTLGLGAAGVAWPTLMSRAVAALVMFFYVLRRNHEVYVTAKDVFAFDSDMDKRILGIAIPGTFENGLFQLSKLAICSIVATFGTSAIAANGIAQNFWSVSSLFSIAMGQAFVTVIGQLMGAGDTEGAEKYFWLLNRITIFFSVLWNFAIIAISPLALMLFNMTPETRRVAFIIIVIHDALNGFFGPGSFAFSKGLTATGDAKFVLLSSIFSTVICRVFFSWLLSVRMGWGIYGIAIAMDLDWIIKDFFIYARAKGGKWKSLKVV